MADHKRKKKKKKKRGRSKLFRSCFRSFPSDERPLINDVIDDRNCNDGRLEKPVFIAVSGRKGEEFVPDVNLVTGNGGDPTQRSSRGRGIARLLKTVWFDSVMAKKIRSSSRSSIASDTSESFSSLEKITKPLDDGKACGRESSDMEEAPSRYSNLLSSTSQTTSTSYSSSSCSSTNSNSRWSSDQNTSSPVDLVHYRPPIPPNLPTSKKRNQTNPNSQSYFDQKASSRTNSFHLSHHDTSTSSPLPKPKRTNSIPQSSSHHKNSTQLDSTDSRNLIPTNVIKSNCNNWNIRWCLFLLLSLVVLVMYGRIYSILCTSTWFYLVPCKRVKRVNSVTNTSRFDTDSDQYKKRVIMAGLLDRTRNPLR